MTFSYTHKYLPSSTAIQEAYYNDEQQELVVVVNGGTAYQYSDFDISDWNAFTSAHSAGHWYAKVIKREFGPGENLGFMNEEDSYFQEDQTVEAPDMGPVWSFKGDLGVNTFVSATTGINAAMSNIRKHTVRFNSGISDREYSVNAVSVDAAVADLMRIARMLGIEEQITVKEVVTHFE